MGFSPKLIPIAQRAKINVAKTQIVGLLNVVVIRIIQLVLGGKSASARTKNLPVSSLIVQMNIIMAILVTKVTSIIFFIHNTRTQIKF
jgi:hypothetical protein